MTPKTSLVINVSESALSTGPVIGSSLWEMEVYGACATGTSTPTPTPTGTGQYPAWAPNTAYSVGARVSYAGLNYQCLQAHTSIVTWEPPNTPALWQPL